jgi:ribosomal protein S18 acetylase RimI-like enzyme
MAITYFKRFRMEIDLGAWLSEPLLPEGYRWITWDESLIGAHADAQYRSFTTELDSQVFPCLGDRCGCLRLLREIRRKPGFLAAATWLVGTDFQICGTIQGVIEPGPIGSIQNLGVVPEHRSLGLGRALLLKSILGFYYSGVPRVSLEVTAENAGAINLYRAVGFRKAKTLYKASDM